MLSEFSYKYDILLMSPQGEGLLDIKVAVEWMMKKQGSPESMYVTWKGLAYQGQMEDG